MAYTLLLPCSDPKRSVLVTPSRSTPQPSRIPRQGAWSGDQDDAVDGAGGVGPRLLDLRQGDGPGADVEGAL